jgi:hypothetical protein
VLVPVGIKEMLNAISHVRFCFSLISIHSPLFLFSVGGMGGVIWDLDSHGKKAVDVRFVCVN